MKPSVAAFAVFLLVPACLEPVAMRHVAAVQAPSDLGCPAARVSSYPYGHHLATEPVFHGCGRMVSYHCVKTVGQGDAACVPVWLGDEKR